MSGDNRILIIGVDGATINLIRQWTAEGLLPNFRRFFVEGAGGHLRTVPNMNSAPAWTSIYTGCNPGRHGIYYFYELRDQSYRVRYLNGSDCAAEPVWSLLSRLDRRVCVLNVPMTYPARPVNGVLISGFDAPALTRDAVHPASLYEELPRILPGYDIEIGLTSYIRRGLFDPLIEKIVASTRRQTRAALHFLRREPWDFFMVVYRGIDIAQHAFWRFDEPEYRALRPDKARRYGGTVRRFYELMDEQLGELLAAAGPNTTVIIVSDHGGGPFHNGIELLPDLLQSEGYLRRLHPRDLPLARRLLGGALLGARRLVYRYTPRTFQGMLTQILPGLHNKTAQMNLFPLVNWPETRVFSTLRPELWVNLRGQYPSGTVDPGPAYDELIGQLRDTLLRWIDPATGQPVLREVKHRDELYHGPFLHKAPDLALFFPPNGNPSGIALRQPDGSSRTIKTLPADFRIDETLGGGHADNGVFLAHGPAIRPGTEPASMHLVDVMPTVLYLLTGQRHGLDGRIVEEVIDPEVLRRVPPRDAAEPAPPPTPPASRTFSPQETADLEKRLKDLGYV